MEQPGSLLLPRATSSRSSCIRSSDHSVVAWFSSLTRWKTKQRRRERIYFPPCRRAELTHPVRLLDSAQGGGGHPGLGRGHLPTAAPCCHGLVQHGTTLSKRGWQKEGQSAGKKAKHVRKQGGKKSHFAGECDRSSILPRRGNKAAVITSCVLHSPGTPSTFSAGSQQRQGTCPPRTVTVSRAPWGHWAAAEGTRAVLLSGSQLGSNGRGRGASTTQPPTGGLWLPYSVHTLKKQHLSSKGISKLFAAHC